VPVVGRLKQGNLLLSGEVNERLPAILDGLVAYYPLDGNTNRFVPGQIRYIRDWVNGNTANTSNHWIEIQAFDRDGTNVALNKTAYNALSISAPMLVDGSLESTQWSGAGMSGADYVTVDLEDLYTIDYIKVWHYYPDGRTYHDTKTAVSDDGINWFVIFDSAIEGEYAETSGGHTVYLDERQETLQPCYESNVSKLPNEVALESPSTNLVDITYNNCGVVGAPSAWGEITVKESKFVDVRTPDGLNKAFYCAWNSGASGGIRVSYAEPNRISASGSTVYTATVYVKYLDHTYHHINTIYIRQYDASNTQLKESGVAASSNYDELGDGWRRYYGTFTTEAATTQIHIDTYLYDYSGNAILITGYQLEQMGYYSSLLNGARASRGMLIVPFVPNSSGFTIHGKVKIYSNTGGGNNWQCLFSLSRYTTYVDTDNFYVSPSSSGSTIALYTRDSAGVSGAAYSVSMPLREWHSLTVVFDGTNANLYYDGEYKTQRSVLLSMLPTFVALGIGTDPNTARSLQGSVKDVALYNRALSSTEVAKLAESSFNMDASGNIKTPIKESMPVRYDVHFELGHNTSDDHRIVAPTTETNIKYNDASIWVGEGTANEFSYPTFDTATGTGGWSHWGQAGSSGSYGQNTDKKFIYDKNQNYSHWVANAAGATGNYLLYQGPAYDGGYRSLQVIACLEDFSPITNEDQIYPAWNANNGSVPTNQWTSIEKLGDSGFYLCKVEGFSQDGSNDLVGVYVKTGIKAYFSQAQLEQKPYCSPFTTSTNGNGILKYTFSEILTPNNDWTVGVFGKPNIYNMIVGTGRTCPIAVGNYYVVGEADAGIGKWGSTSAPTLALFGYESESGRYGGSMTLSEQDYSNWCMFSIRYDHTNDYAAARVFGSSGTMYQSNCSGHTMVGLQPIVRLGGYSWDEDCWDGYLRDFFIAKRAISDSELESMFATFMRSKPDILEIQSQVIEGAAL